MSFRRPTGVGFSAQPLTAPETQDPALWEFAIVPEPRVPHIFVVDDEEIIASTLGLILQSVGYSVAVAYSGEQALQLAESRPPDMLISDVIMSGIDGLHLAAELKQKLPACGNLLFSGQFAAAMSCAPLSCAWGWAHRSCGANAARSR